MRICELTSGVIRTHHGAPTRIQIWMFLPPDLRPAGEPQLYGVRYLTDETARRRLASSAILGQRDEFLFIAWNDVEAALPPLVFRRLDAVLR